MKISKLHLIGEMSLQIIICILILSVFFIMLSIQVFMYQIFSLKSVVCFFFRDGLLSRFFFSRSLQFLNRCMTSNKTEYKDQLSSHVIFHKDSFTPSIICFPLKHIHCSPWRLPSSHSHQNPVISLSISLRFLIQLQHHSCTVFLTFSFP